MGEITHFPEETVPWFTSKLLAQLDYKIKRQTVKASHYFTIQHF